MGLAISWNGTAAGRAHTCPAAPAVLLPDLPPPHPSLPPSLSNRRYFRFTGAMLPVEYNTMASDSLHGNVTIGGQAPAIVHFTQNKPFAGAVPGKPGHQFLCSAEELRRSRSS